MFFLRGQVIQKTAPIEVYRYWSEENPPKEVEVIYEKVINYENKA